MQSHKSSLPPSRSIRPEDLDDNERTSITKNIREAISGGNIDRLKRLLTTDKVLACIDEEQGEAGGTPLHLASSWRNYEAVKLLVENGADINALNEGAGTPLTCAAVYGYEKIAKYLLSKGASKEKAIEAAYYSDRALVEGFFIEIERVAHLRPKLEARRQQLEASVVNAEKPQSLPTTTKGITITGLRKMKSLIQSECRAGRFRDDASFPDGTNSKGTMNYEEVTTTDVVYRYVKDKSVTGDLRLSDSGVLGDDKYFTLPTLFISHVSQCSKLC